jgi:hypothetical protein
VDARIGFVASNYGSIKLYAGKKLSKMTVLEHIFENSGSTKPYLMQQHRSYTKTAPQYKG